MSQRLEILFLIAAALTAGPVAAQHEPACWAQAQLEPPRAVVGQQVLYRVRIFSLDRVDSVEWAHSPSFPSLRSETLPGDPQPLSRSELAADVRARDERRALFAERAGVHTLRAPELRCTAKGGAVEIARVPEIVLQVDALPHAGRPEQFDGLVGPVSLHVSVTPQELALGESLRVALMIRGGGNLWAIDAPFAQHAFGSAEVFASRPELVLERGRKLLLRRHFAFDVVPRSVGALTVPAVALAYYDPATQSYLVARSEPARVTVSARAAETPAAPAQRARPGDRSGPPRPSRRWIWLLVPLLLLALFPLARRLRGGGGDRVQAALSEAAELEASGERDPLAAALLRALRAALTGHVDDALSVAPEELMARHGLAPPVAAAAHLLATLERARFDPEAPPPDPGAVRRAISEL